MTTLFSDPQHQAVWLLARPWLDVRSNDIHTLHAYTLGQALLQAHPQADADIALTAILLHDTGWKLMPVEKLTSAIGPNAKYPELQREHEIAGVGIAQDVLASLAWPQARLDRVLAIIDGHDTRKHALSLEDSLMKDADKLWRFTPHGIRTIGGWFEQSTGEIVAMLHSYVVPQLLTEQGRLIAAAYLATAQTDLLGESCLNLN